MDDTLQKNNFVCIAIPDLFYISFLLSEGSSSLKKTCPFEAAGKTIEVLNYDANISLYQQFPPCPHDTSSCSKIALSYH